jgi:aspartate aminotransferase
MVKLSDATPVVIEAGIEQDFRITARQLDEAITERTKLLFLNSPSNPTGTSYSRADFDALAKVLEQHPQIVTVSDEIYEPIHWADEPFVSFASACPSLSDRIVTVNGVSKAYAMTGWRIGYAAGPEKLITAMTTIQSQSTSNPCSISQKAAEAALDGDQTVVSDMAEIYRQRHDFVVDALNNIAGFECRAGEGTFYAFPRITRALDKLGIASDTDFTEFLINEADVAVVPGTAFGAPGHIRLSFACSLETLKEAIERISRVVTA